MALEHIATTSRKACEALKKKVGDQFGRTVILPYGGPHNTSFCLHLQDVDARVHSGNSAIFQEEHVRGAITLGGIFEEDHLQRIDMHSFASTLAKLQALADPIAEEHGLSVNVTIHPSLPGLVAAFYKKTK